MLSDYCEPFRLLRAAEETDETGGVRRRWSEAGGFSGALTHALAEEAPREGLRRAVAGPVLYAPADILLREGDRVLRVSDGSCYLVRGSSRDFASPPAMGLCAVPVEKEADHA